MTTVGTFYTSVEAHLLRTRLEAEGIPAFVKNENIVTLDWFLGPAIGGIHVQVHDDDAEMAETLLAREEEPLELDESGMPLPGQGVLQPVVLACPQCGSWDLRPLEVKAVMSSDAPPFLGYPLPLPVQTVQCADCRYEWTPQIDEDPGSEPHAAL